VRRRLLIVAAVLMGIAAIATSSLAPRLPAPPPRQTATPTADPGSGGATASAQPAGEPAAQAMRADRTGQEARGRVGQRLVLEVSATAPISVQLGEDGPIDGADAGSPARFELYLDEPASLPVSVLDADRVVGRVIVTE
jgi:hypothetical protein